MKKFLEIFKKVNGFKIIKQYFHAHVLLYAIILSLFLGYSKKSLEILRLAVNNKILSKLRKKYKKTIKEFMIENSGKEYLRTKSNKVWFCWFQGLENAPEIVKKCYESLINNLIDKDIIVITEKNYRKFINFPEFIQEKIDKGIITKTHLSDLLRLELLINYGGTWIDSTVYCSGNEYDKELFESDLFMFQCLKPGLDGHSTRISSWFMTSCTNNSILLLTRYLLYEYWKRNNVMVDYFLLHDFLEIAIENYGEEWKKVMPISNSLPHILLLRLFDPFDENIWKNIKKEIAFHKLTYKLNEKDLEKDDTYYKKVLGI